MSHCVSHNYCQDPTYEPIFPSLKNQTTCTSYNMCFGRWILNPNPPSNFLNEEFFIETGSVKIYETDPKTKKQKK